MRRSQDAEFEAFVRRHRAPLVGTARLLTAGDAHLAEDLVQSTLVKVYLAWGRASQHPAAYARRTLVNCLTDHRRRPFFRREQGAVTLPEAPVEDPAMVDPELRAAVVLRHVHDLSVEEVADALSCSTGTVKSQTARGLDKLRALLTPTQLTGDSR
ncbi:sigma factor-like helix-turn-helix DNA-binding protein [Nocardioides sp. NPDC000445]|uniref:sigma factor-like helix-turn-helix DNA-binding protein n=1 Tax=Nocardioides sp. NPDC000445 TaxID=3154257 RepID=UPI003317AB69